MDGETYTEDLLPSKGSPQNPMTQQELEDKFMGRATSALPRDQRAAARPSLPDRRGRQEPGGGQGPAWPDRPPSGPLQPNPILQRHV